MPATATSTTPATPRKPRPDNDLRRIARHARALTNALLDYTDRHPAGLCPCPRCRGGMSLTECFQALAYQASLTEDLAAGEIVGGY